MGKNNLFFEDQFTEFKPLLLEIGERYLLEKGSVITNNHDTLYLYYVESGSLNYRSTTLKEIARRFVSTGRVLFAPIP